jgi:hypothetical protein
MSGGWYGAAAVAHARPAFAFLAQMIGSVMRAFDTLVRRCLGSLQPMAGAESPPMLTGDSHNTDAKAQRAAAIEKRTAETQAVASPAEPRPAQSIQ